MVTGIDPGGGQSENDCNKMMMAWWCRCLVMKNGVYVARDNGW